jgi:hypothetical protein
MPMAKNRGAAWGAMSKTSPMIVCFSILTAIIMTSFGFFRYYNRCFNKKQDPIVKLPKKGHKPFSWYAEYVIITKTGKKE